MWRSFRRWRRNVSPGKFQSRNVKNRTWNQQRFDYNNRDQLFGIRDVDQALVKTPTETSRCIWTELIRAKDMTIKMTVSVPQPEANFKYIFKTPPKEKIISLTLIFFFNIKIKKKIPDICERNDCSIWFCLQFFFSLLFQFFFSFSFPWDPGPLVSMVPFVPVPMVACIKRLISQLSSSFLF